MNKRLKIPKLREMDDTMLQVVTSDALTMLMDFVDPETMCDLLAISEARLPVQLQADFTAFRDQMHRDMADLPRGAVLAKYLSDLGEVPADQVPNTFRQEVLKRKDDAMSDPVSAGPFEELVEAWSGTPFDPVDRDGDAIRSAQVITPEVPNRLKTPVEREKAASPRSGAARKARAAKPSVDPEREKWLRQALMQRLKQYEGRGLKESVLVAGTIRRSPHPNTKRSEVMSVLRKLKRENLVKESSGRWILRGRW